MAERTVSLKILTESDGGAGIKSLVAELEKLAAQGGEATPELQALANEIKQLEAARNSVTALNALDKATQDLATGISAAKGKVAELAPQLLSANQATQQLAAAQTAAGRALDTAKASVEAANLELKKHQAAMREAGGGTVEMVTQENALKTALKEARSALTEKNSALKEANAALTTAQREEKALGDEIAKSSRTIERLNTEVDKQAAAFNKNATEAEKLGVDVRSLASEEQRLNGALTASSTAARDLAQNIEKTAAAAKELKAAQLFEEQRQAAIEAQKAAEYTNWWAEALNKADAAAKALKAAKADEAIRQEAVAAQKAAEYTNWWADALDRADAAQRRSAAASKSVADNIEQAFGVVGVRSLASMEAEIHQIEQALRKLEVLAQSGKITWAEYERAEVSAVNKITKIRDGFTGTNEEMTKLRGGTAAFASGLGTLGGILAGMQLGTEFVKANVELQKVQRSMTALTGSSAAAGKELEFVRQAADNMGVEFFGLAGQYASLMAATKGTALEGEKTRQVFTATANALTQMGRGSVEAQHAFMALAQMASKGVISAEELKQQLSEALPGASQAAARGLGLTTAELDKLVRSGKLLAEDFFPAFSKGLNSTFGETQAKKIDGIAQSWYRLVNAAKQVGTALGEIGGNKTISTVLDAVTGSANALTTKLKEAGVVAEKTGQVLANLIPDRLAAKFKEINDGAKELERQQAQANQGTYQKVIETLDRWIEKTGGVKKAQDAAKPSIDASASSAEKMATTSTAAALAQGDLGKATEAAGKQAELAALGWVKVNVEYEKTVEAVEAVTKLSVKQAEAAKLEGDAAIRLAELTGNETTQRLAAVDAATRNEGALRKVFEARNAEAAVLQAQIIALQEEGKATNGLSAEKEKLLNTMKQELAAKQAEAEKSRQAAENASLEAAQKRVLSEAYKDNSARVGEFREAARAAEAQAGVLNVTLESQRKTVEALEKRYEEAKKTLVPYQERIEATAMAVKDFEVLIEKGEKVEKQLASARLANAEALAEYRDKAASVEQVERNLNDAKDKALGTEDKLAESRKKAAEATALYRDALKDALFAEEQRIAKLEQGNNLAEVGLKLKLEEAKTAEKLADATNDEVGAIQAKVRQKEIEIQIVKANAAATRTEIDAKIALARQEIENLKLTGEWTPAKEAEIEARIRALEVKKAELALSDQQVAQLQAEIDKLYNLQAAKEAVNNTPLEPTTPASGSPMGPSGASGANSAGVAYDYEALLYKMGASVEEVQKALQTANAEINRQFAVNPVGTTSNAQAAMAQATKRVMDGLTEALRKVREGTSSSVSGGSAVSSPTGNLLGSNPLVRSSQPVTINIGGNATSFNLASSSDVTALEQVLRQLSTGMNRA